MPISVKCPNCGKGIKAPDAAVGKNAPCPACKQPFLIQAETSAPAPGPAPAPQQTPAPASDNPFAFDDQGGAAAAGPEVSGTVIEQAPAGFSAAPQQAPTPPADQGPWHVTMADGQQYGPIPKSDLDAWVAEGRITEGCQLFCQGWENWKPFAEVYGAGGGSFDQTPVRVSVQELITDSSGNIQPSWYVLSRGLLFVQIVAFFATACLIAMILGLLFGISSGGRRGGGGELGMGMMVYGAIAFVFANVSLFTCWCFCLNPPGRTRGTPWITSAVGCWVAVVIIEVIIVVTFVSAMRSGFRGMGRPGDAQLVAGFLLVVILLFWFTGLAMFVLFVNAIGTFFRRPGFPLLGYIGAGTNGFILIWVILDVFVINPQSSGGAIAMLIVTLLLLAVAYGFMGALTLMASKPLQGPLRTSRQ